MESNMTNKEKVEYLNILYGKIPGKPAIHVRDTNGKPILTEDGRSILTETYKEWQKNVNPLKIEWDKEVDNILKDYVENQSFEDGLEFINTAIHEPYNLPFNSANHPNQSKWFKKYYVRIKQDILKQYEE